MVFVEGDTTESPDAAAVGVMLRVTLTDRAACPP
jgi:hypothetical protein